uniref:Uncharacterized protein n=1 Tax=Candidatus Kentrum sp. TUN TaxID=2126343 RepID=A0A450ZLA5_9GAMM|nr:MAG: hypothetical protein BECKTUN1418F_GA0071002_104611 [Candidatus Kentron sp. TUN]VFK56835.1 MAG: hypothetical protein BECKTUN1418E_GA0071001_104311 [Candidatus Kentron sp. TUN]VFK57462.1 MAG: hypothetical protein BECKTUN1418D_GA0071000_10636 [Candidatus Kentron sp. TUN]
MRNTRVVDHKSHIRKTTDEKSTSKAIRALRKITLFRFGQIPEIANDNTLARLHLGSVVYWIKIRDTIASRYRFMFPEFNPKWEYSRLKSW